MAFRLPEPLTPIKLIEKRPGLYTLERPLREVDRANGRVLVDGLGDMILMSSYSYLGLIGHPEINEAAHRGVRESGTGVHGVRLLAGTLPSHVALERKIAHFLGFDEAIVFSSGYVTNVATIAALVGPGDAVFTDVLNHASIQDGCRLSGADIVSFAHNNMPDLRRKLERAPPSGNKLIVVDGVFSMDGDIADLHAILELAQEHSALVMVDEAHSLGVIGPTGRGILEHFGLSAHPSLLMMGTLSKTIPSVGGYIAARGDIIRLLRHRARGYIFSSALPASCVEAAAAALDVIDREAWRVIALQKKAYRFRAALQAAGISTLRSQTAVIPALCGESLVAVEVSRYCFAHGLFALPVTYPAVQAHLARLRLIPTTVHSDDDLARAVEIVIAGFDACGVPRGSAPRDVSPHPENQQTGGMPEPRSITAPPT